MNLFKRKQQIEEQSNYEYWKDPRLDDEGTYDYLVEDLPGDTAKWEWYYTKCNSCGKYHKLNFVQNHYFYCWDGWDGMDYTECWKCVLKNKLHSLKRKTIGKLKKRIAKYREYRNDIKSIEAKLGHPIPKETKKHIKRIIIKEVYE